MKIAHVFNSSVVSGPETLVVPVLRELGENASIILLAEQRRANEVQAVEAYMRKHCNNVEVVPIRSRVDLRAIAKFGALLKARNYSVVHAHDVKASTYLLGAKWISRFKGMIVSTHHGVRARPGKKLKLYESFYTRFICPFFDRVFAVCNSDRELLIKRGLPSSKVHVHRNGVTRTLVTEEERQKRRQQIRKEWGISSDVVAIGMIGRLAPEKRVDRALALAYELKRNYLELPEWKLVVFGSGPLEKELKQQVKALDLEDRVEFVGYRKNVSAELSALDMVLSVSDAEGLPITMLEAGWAGTPVVATAVDGVRDLVADPRLGLLLDPQSSDLEMARMIAPLISSPIARRKLGQAFQHWIASHFSGHSWLSQLRAEYEALLAA